MMLTHCGNNVRNRYSGCVFSVKDIVPVPLKTSRNLSFKRYPVYCIALRICSKVSAPSYTRKSEITPQAPAFIQLESAPSCMVSGSGRQGRPSFNRPLPFSRPLTKMAPSSEVQATAR